jgi:hypothetical protein
MKSFQTFLKEEAEEGSKLKHITHPEDRPLFHGHEGFEHAHGALTHAHEHMKSGASNSNLTTKYDGSPAVVFGTHPKTKKFFVATKSAFNKDPKINHTAADIEKNHGHAPGLVTHLKAALEHLPKVTPKGKVYQGDLMHSGGDKGTVSHDKKTGKSSFTPNTITYTASGDEAKKAAKSKVGIAVHTQYHGKDIGSMSAHHEVDHSEFGQHSDVHHHDASFNTSTAKYPQKSQDEFHKHMNAAKAIHDEHGSKMYSAVHPKHSGDAGHLGTYINHTVRNDSVPNVKDFKAHVQGIHDKKAAKVSTDKAKAVHTGEGNAQVAHIEKNKGHYENLLNQHHHLAQAKNTLVKHLETGHSGYEHHIEGKESKPEGFVINHEHNGKTEPSKLVNRAEFAKQNLLKTRKPKTEE